MMQPRVETEIALVLGNDLDDPNISITDILQSIDFGLASLKL
ncbi:MAG: hypothetical protein R2879_14940 [Saprospiraceae bacterium]